MDFEKMKLKDYRGIHSLEESQTRAEKNKSSKEGEDLDNPGSSTFRRCGAAGTDEVQLQIGYCPE